MDGLNQVPHELKPRFDFENAQILPDKVLNEPLGKTSLETKNAEDHFKNWEEKPLLSEKELNSPLLEKNINQTEGLSDNEKIQLIKETNWSEKIVDFIQNPEEAAVYKDANLKEVNGNLERSDIDWSAKIPENKIERMRSLYGDEVADKWASKTNLDLTRDGKAPYGQDGERINLHHIGQKADSPLAELTNREHKANDIVLHDKTKNTEIERPVFRIERQQYWMARYDELQKNR